MPFKFAITAGLGILLVGLTLLLQGPGVLQDYQHRADRFEAVAMRVTEARCKNVYFIVSLCSVQLRGPNDKFATAVDQIFLGNMGGQEVFGMAPHSDPQALTTNVGIQYLGNRILALGLIALLGAVGMWALLRQAMS
jgi:hypothetical protein